MKQVLKFKYFDSPGDSVWLGSSFRRRKSCKETPRSWSWGATTPISSFHSHKPHFQIIWMKQCREDFHYKKSWISSKMMCTFRLDTTLIFFLLFFFWKLIARQNSDACQGDSGGPLVRVNPTSGRYEQVQLASLLNFFTQNTFVNLHPSVIDRG